MAFPDLWQKIDALPVRPGVYLFRDSAGSVLYVGKSRNLRTRVRSYFLPGSSLTPHKQLMVKQVVDLDFVVTEDEVEALILEFEFITTHDPPFNIIFRDGKSYPLIKVTNETWPRIMIVRRRLRDGARYFGPYPDSTAVRIVTKALGTIVPLRSCRAPSGKLTRNRPCINHEIGLCCGPCAGEVTPEDYAGYVERAIRLLRGDHDDVIEALTEVMHQAAKRLDFERAAVVRDRIRAFRRLRTRQRVVGDPRRSEDVVAVVSEGRRTCIQVLSVRHGRMIGQRKIFVDHDGVSTGRILHDFLAYAYLPTEAPPRAVIVSETPDEFPLLREGFKARFGDTTVIRIPVSDRGRRLVSMALDNARLHLEAQGEHPALELLAAHLGLSKAPRRIECFDVSVSGGRDAVASMVVFLDGRPHPPGYRRFKIATVEGTDDYASLAEAVTRRYRRVLHEGGDLPQLIVVDGGEGQVEAVRRALMFVEGAERLPVIGLAKREERIVGPGLGTGLLLPPNDPARLLLQRIRDEAHRRAVGHHRLLRARRSLASVLDDIVGVGPRLRAELLRRFGQIDSLRHATEAELTTVPGVGPRKAALIREGLEKLT